MASLGMFDSVRENLRHTRKQNVVALHKFIFEHEGDRSNRQRLREFEGFEYDEKDEAFEKKAAYVNKNLTLAELTSICNILCISYDDRNLMLHIFGQLKKGSLLNAINNEDENDDDDDDNDASRNDDEVAATNLHAKRVKHQEGVKQNKKTVNDDDESFLSIEDNNYENTMTTRATQPQVSRFAMSFRDIEDSIRTFDGKGNLPVDAWIEEFEETAAIMNWDEFQMYIFAKKSISGLAKLFIQSERGITSWKKLKAALIGEFRTTMNSAQIHKQLSERKMKKGETVQEYFLHIKETASRGCIDDDSIIQYVIDGINDLNVNKSILYGANDMKDFKRKLACYEKFRLKEDQKSYREKSENKFKNNKDVNESKPKNNSELKCFNCGSKGHKSKECTSKEKGTKCFQCNKFGHIAKDCPEKTVDNKTNTRILKTQNLAMTKSVKIGGREYTALFDTGSKFSIMSDIVFKNLNGVKLDKCDFHLVGFGQNKTKPDGQFKYDIEIDNENYNVNFVVVSSKFIDIDVIIGENFCEYAEIDIRRDGLHFRKIVNDNEFAVMKIDIAPDEIDINPSASPFAKQKVVDMVENYQPKKCKTTSVEMSIVLKEDEPIFSRPRRLPLAERKAVEDQVDQWLQEGVIEPSDSEFSSPIVMVKKRDGTLRLCVDYRRVNKAIVKDRYPLPLIEDQLDRLQNAKIFSSIDLKNGFFHVNVAESSRKYTSFVTHNGQYQFTKVPFGLSNSPAVFQRFINTIFRDLTRTGVALPYVDDVIIPAKDEDEALKNLELVMQLCGDYGLELNLKKCKFLKTRIEFLGHVIENQQISPSPGKVEAVLRFPIPRNMKQLQSFLGLAGYFRKFIPQFSLIAKPLSDLTKANTKFEMKDQQVEAFNKLKSMLTVKPVLSIFNQNSRTEVHTDASIEGYGAVLMQVSSSDGNLHPVYYMSRKTTDAERKYSSYELEILAVIEALKKFRVYLLGLHFKIVTDCNAFTKTLEKKDLSTRVARWVLLLQEYDYEVEHRAGVRMKHVDSLSRYPVMMIGENSTLMKIKQAQLKDEELQTIFSILKDRGNYDGYFMKGDVLYKLVDGYEVIVVPKGMQREIIRFAHEKGHFAVKKVKELIRREYYIPKLEEKIEFHISNCIPCIINNRKRGKQEGELHPLNKVDIPLHTYHIDHLGPLESTSKQYKHILAVVDSFTKFCWLYPTKSTTTKEVIDKLQVQSMTFGNPVQIISDRGTAFSSEDFKNYCEAENIKHHLITTGLPRANGQVERLNSVIISVLSKLSVSDPTKWYKHVGRVQQVINSTYSRSINTTPFDLLIGVPMRTSEQCEIKKLIEEEIVSQFNEEREEIRQSAKEQMAKMQAENRKSYNLRRKKATQYAIGDLVAIKRTQFGSGLKLKPKFLGPYEVTSVKPNDTYNVERVGETDGPRNTTTCAEYMKPWCSGLSDDEFEANPDQDGRIVG